MRYDICIYFHGLNDVGHGDGPFGYGRPHTYEGECYLLADQPQARCRRRGRCVVAQLAKKAATTRRTP